MEVKINLRFKDIPPKYSLLATKTTYNSLEGRQHENQNQGGGTEVEAVLLMDFSSRAFRSRNLSKLKPERLPRRVEGTLVFRAFAAMLTDMPKPLI